MSNLVEQAPDASRVSQSSACRVLIAVPFYKNEELVGSVVDSLIACAADLAAIGGEVVFFDDSPDYAPLRQALDAILPAAQSAFRCRIVRNAANMGFVRTMNQAVAEAVARKADLLLLNSDTIVHPGALTEMVRVAELDSMIAFVNPRSDNATLATLPVQSRLPKDSVVFDPAPYRALAARLPEYSFVPTAVGFCMLIRWHILAEFGGFDEVYGPGYNEENDLVMRAGRCGYRAVLANWAFVQHESERSFSTAKIEKSALEPINRAILDARYPEYTGLTSAYFGSPEATAEQLLGALIPNEAGRLDLAFDFSSFTPIHNGTFQAGKQLLKSALEDWSDRFDVHVLCTPEAYEFHGYAALGVPRRDPHGTEKFAVIFREGQPYDWSAIQRLAHKGAVIGVCMLDTISIDCTQLTSPLLHNYWQFVLTHIDLLVTPSQQSMDQFEHRFDIAERVTRVLSYLSLDLRDYVLAPAETTSDEAGEGATAHKRSLLVVGNHFPHKYLVPTVNALAAALPDQTIISLGQAKPALDAHFNPYALQVLNNAPNIVGVEVGRFDDADFAAFYADADAVVFPSHYEGFGYPVLNALAARRPIFVRRLPVFVELWESQGRNPNIHFYETTADLIERLKVPPRWKEPQALPLRDNGTARSAREIRAGLDVALGRATYRDIAQRVRAMQFSGNSAMPAPPLPLPPAAELPDMAARYFAWKIEAVVRRLLRVRAIYLVSRLVFKTMRAVVRTARAVKRGLTRSSP